jgi:peroxiredoxin
MKSVRPTLSLILVLGLACAATTVLAGDGLALGQTAPKTDVKMKNVDGRELSIAETTGPKGTLVIFMCNACPWVKAWQDRIVELGNDYSTQGIGVIAINANDPGKVAEDGFDVMKERARDKGMKFPYVMDATSGVARAFGATRTPEAFLFDASGKLVYHGTIDDNAQNADKVEKHYLHDALQAVVSGGAVPVAETKALGCSIKFRS